MDIDLVVILLRHILRVEALGSKWVLCHESGSYSLVDLCIKFSDRADALGLFSILSLPDRERSTPVTAT